MRSVLKMKQNNKKQASASFVRTYFACLTLGIKYCPPGPQGCNTRISYLLCGRHVSKCGMLGLPSHVSAPWMAFSFPSTLSLLETASLLLLTVSAETRMKNWQEAYSLYLPHNAKTLSSYYRTWIMNLFLVCVFLVTFLNICN